MAETSRKWQFWIDRGGTFTDITARTPDGVIQTRKLLSENPEQYADAALEGIARFLGLKSGEKIPEEMLDHVKMGTTVATNALLERKGERTALLITEGFADALRIGYQNRPRLFDMNIILPEMLFEKVVEARERVSATGDVLQVLDEVMLDAQLRRVFNDGIRSIAIVFMHGYRYTDHENRAAKIAGRIGFTQISLSHKASPLMKLVSRGDTTVVDAYLSPILRRYVERVANELGGTKLMFMRSSGGLTDARMFQGKDSILSGPAGGVVGMARTATIAGFKKIIGFDMGGTSTDVSHYDGEFERVFDTQVAGIRMRAPMMNIHTVAAGGGSILHFDGNRFRVGPGSAGADPGPACYRRGGPLTVTDCNVMLGKIQPRFFPNVFGVGASEPLDEKIVSELFANLARDVEKASGEKQSPQAIAEGFLHIAVENMANAIKKISVEQGRDITGYTLNCFGGAGGQHACMVADALGMESILIHRFAGVLSAYGMGLADFTAIRTRAMEAVLDDGSMDEANVLLDELAMDGQKEILDQGIASQNINVVRKIHLRYMGTDSALVLDAAPIDLLIADFEITHKRRFGFIQPKRKLIIEAVSVEAIGQNESINSDLINAAANPPSDHANGPTPPLDTVTMASGGKQYQVNVLDISALGSDEVVMGPAIICDINSTTVIEPGWQAQYTSIGNLVLSRHVPRPRRESIGTKADPVMLEIFNNLFMSIAEQMGATLSNTAHSVNIKERLDFSCAVFDHGGNLVANAPHMPVHLGSMGESVKAIIEGQPDMAPGDVFAINAPYNGGTHLPDITIVTPVFDERRGGVIFYVASRGHHADIGGITPGSMPPNSKSVKEEGVLIDNVQVVKDGRFLETDIRKLLSSGRYPARNIDQNIADLGAQIAANEKGVFELRKMTDHFGLDVVNAYMNHVQDNAEETIRRVIDNLGGGKFAYEMDDGSKIKVSITIDKSKRKAVVDFTGTSAQQPTNFNAPLPVCRAAVLYVFRTLARDEIPLNAGCLKPVEIIIPDGCMLSPVYPAAVVAGNVETSQCITDALYGALGVMAGAQGTMNNFTFGNDKYQYYETICGGAGAGPDFDGQNAVHTHMTNSRLTDPEILEWRFPVLVESFSIRTGSGGKGAFHGGDGVVRKIKFNQAMNASILSNHRIIAPFGLNGGEPGALGVNYVTRCDNSIVSLGPTASIDLQAGDTFVIETPGGGGFGAKH